MFQLGYLRSLHFFSFFKMLFHIIPLVVISSGCYAGGGITHMFLAKETVSRLKDPQLRQLLKDNLDVYLIGAAYPDSGYFYGTHYGEDSHWDEFIFTFADYIKDKYPEPFLQNPKLIAFLLGCATHRLSDDIMHGNFYYITAKEDFNNDWNTAHKYGDVGIDLLIVIDKNEWFTSPANWWVPVKDLVEVYRRMGKNYTATEIIWGNTVTYLANYSEPLIAAPAYLFLKWRMQWTAKHYYDWPMYGLTMNENETAEYLTTVWKYLNDRAARKKYDYNKKTSRIWKHEETAMSDFSSTLIKSGAISLPVKANEDGSVEIKSPFINSFIYFQNALTELFNKITK